MDKHLTSLRLINPTGHLSQLLCWGDGGLFLPLFLFARAPVLVPFAPSDERRP
jgi:hypothetical protein